MSWSLARGLARLLCRPRVTQCCPTHAIPTQDVRYSEDSGVQSAVVLTHGQCVRLLADNPNRRTVILQCVSEGSIGGVGAGNALWTTEPTTQSGVDGVIFVSPAHSDFGVNNQLILTRDVHGSIVCRSWYATNMSESSTCSVLAIEVTDLS